MEGINQNKLLTLAFMLACARPVTACSCSSYEPIKACQIYQSTPVIFRGRVIDHNHDKTAGFGQMTLYRFKVIEAFKGLAPDTKEVFIDPASLTSCYTEFALDRDYLVYTGGSQPALAVGTRLGGWPPNSPEKRTPEAWKGLEQVPVFTVGGCNPTRAVRDIDPDIEFLRSAAFGGPPASGWIEGRAVQNFSWPYDFAEFVAASDAKLTVTSPSGDRWETAVQADGTFKIGPVPPGTYAVSVGSPSLGKAADAKPEIQVPSGGCGVANASFKTESTISGRVLDADGKPASRVRLELGELRVGGKVRVIPDTWTNTDRDGNFSISNVPVGRVVLGANLNGAPSSGSPFDAVYVPGTQSVSTARVFEVEPGHLCVCRRHFRLGICMWM